MKTNSPRTDAATAPAMLGTSLFEATQVAAYFLAEKRGFAPGGELGDWLLAEAELRTRGWCDVSIVPTVAATEAPAARKRATRSPKSTATKSARAPAR